MSSTQPAFGGMFRQLIELGVIGINTEPLDDRIELTNKQRGTPSLLVTLLGSRNQNTRGLFG